MQLGDRAIPSRFARYAQAIQRSMYRLNFGKVYDTVPLATYSATGDVGSHRVYWVYSPDYVYNKHAYYGELPLSRLPVLERAEPWSVTRTNTYG